MQTALYAAGLRARHPNRRGVLTAWTIWLMLAAGAIVGGLFNVLWISCVRNQAQNCAASAALSAGHRYLSDDMLRAWQQPFEYEGRVARSRDAAIEMVERARAGTSLPPITDDQVEVLWGAEQSAAKDPSLLVPEKIVVSFDRNKPPHSIVTFFDGLAGNRASGLGVSAAVCLEHAPIVFSLPLTSAYLCCHSAFVMMSFLEQTAKRQRQQAIGRRISNPEQVVICSAGTQKNTASRTDLTGCLN